MCCIRSRFGGDNLENEKNRESRTRWRRVGEEVPIPIPAPAGRYVPAPSPREHDPLPRKLSLPSHLPCALCARSAAPSSSEDPEGVRISPGVMGRVPGAQWEHLAGAPNHRWHRGSSPASVHRVSLTTTTTAGPAVPPLHPPPLPTAPCRLSPTSSTLHPRGQPLRRARGQPQPPGRAATASPTLVQSYAVWQF